METVAEGLRPQRGGKASQMELLACTAAAALFALAVALVFGMRYQVNDDAIISNIAAGAYGGASQYLVYVNVLLGWFLKPFYALAPGLNWFVAWQLAGGVLCFGLLGGAAVQALGRLRGGMVYLVFLALAGLDFFSRFHYVKYATLFLATGLVLLARNLGRWNAATIGGMALAFVGSLLRLQQAVAVGGMAAALLLWLFLRLDAAAKKRAAVAAGALLLAVLAAAGIDAAAYRADAGWAQFVRFNAARTEISDFRLQYLENPEGLAALGYSENDVAMVERWLYYDGEVFPVERVEELAAALPGNTLGRAVKQTLYTGLGMLHTKPVNLLFCAVLLAWLLFSGKRRWPALAGTLALLAAMVLYLHWRGRLPPRIEYCLVLCAVLLVACCFVPREKEAPPARWPALAAAVLLVACVPAYTQELAESRDYWQSRPPRAADVDAIAADKAHLYIADADLVDAANGYNIWRARPAGYFSNIVFAGSWLMQAPPQNEAMANYGVANMYADAIDNPAVLYADTYNRELKETYLREHYNPAARVLPVEEHGSYTVFRVAADGNAE